MESVKLILCPLYLIILLFGMGAMASPPEQADQASGGECSCQNDVMHYMISKNGITCPTCQKMKSIAGSEQITPEQHEAFSDVDYPESESLSKIADLEKLIKMPFQLWPGTEAHQFEKRLSTSDFPDPGDIDLATYNWMIVTAMVIQDILKETAKKIIEETGLEAGLEELISNKNTTLKSLCEYCLANKKDHRGAEGENIHKLLEKLKINDTTKFLFQSVINATLLGMQNQEPTGKDSTNNTNRAALLNALKDGGLLTLKVDSIHWLIRKTSPTGFRLYLPASWTTYHGQAEGMITLLASLRNSKRASRASVSIPHKARRTTPPEVQTTVCSNKAATFAIMDIDLTYPSANK